MGQLPDEAQGAAIGIMIYTIVCMLCNILMLWLLWTAGEILSRKWLVTAPKLHITGPISTDADKSSPDIGMICAFLFVAVLVNMIQQINDNL